MPGRANKSPFFSLRARRALDSEVAEGLATDPELAAAVAAGGGSGDDLMGVATDWADLDVPRYDIDQGRFVSSGPRALSFLQNGGAPTTQFNIGNLGQQPAYPTALDANEPIVLTEEMRAWDDIGVDISYPPQGAILPEPGVYLMEAGFFGVTPGPGYTGPNSPESSLLKTFGLGITTFCARSLSPNNSLAVGNATLGRDIDFGGLVVSTVQDFTVDLGTTFLGEAAAGQYGFTHLSNWSCARHDDTPRDGILDGHTLNGVYFKITKIG